MPTSPSQSPTFRTRAAGWGKAAWDKSYIISDKIAVYANAGAHKVGAEAFWPAAGDTVKEMEKCARILTDFTSKGVEDTVTKEVVDKTTGQKVKKQRKVLKKIPPAVIRQAHGLIIFTAFRTGIAPFAGAGGCGMIIARLPDGSWSAPSSLMPQNLSAGLMLGIDIYDVVLVIRTEKALQSFFSHKLALGAEVAVVGGPYGAGLALDSGKEAVPCFSYIKSRGFYAGVEMTGTVLVSRVDEMGRFYHTPGIKAGDILTGKCKMPWEAKAFHDAITAAENLSATDSYEMMADEYDGLMVDVDGLELDESETLHLPPTPAQLDLEEKLQGVTFEAGWRAQEEAQKTEEEEKLFRPGMAPKENYLIPPPPKRVNRTSTQSSTTSEASSAYSEASTVGEELFRSESQPTQQAPVLQQIAVESSPPPIPQRRRPVTQSRPGTPDLGKSQS